MFDNPPGDSILIATIYNRRTFSENARCVLQTHCQVDRWSIKPALHPRSPKKGGRESHEETPFAERAKF